MITFVNLGLTIPKLVSLITLKKQRRGFPTTAAKVDDVTTHRGVDTVVTKEDDAMKHPELNTETTIRDDRADGAVEGQDQSSQDHETIEKDSVAAEETENREENTSAVAKFNGNTTSIRKIKLMKEVEKNRWFKIGSGIRRYMFITLFLPMVFCNIILLIVMNLKHM